MTDEAKPVLSTVADQPNMYLFWCPGCECAHFFDERWTRTGTLERPTVTPSIRVRGPKGGDGRNHAISCHLFVRDGKLMYLNDCDHALAGKTVEMTPI